MELLRVDKDPLDGSTSGHFMEEEAILAILSAEPDRVFNQNELLRRAGATPKKEKSAKRILKALVQRGVVERLRGRSYRMSRKGQKVEGTVEVDGRGRMVLHADGKRRDPLPIVPEESAMLEPGDRIAGEVVPGGRRGRLFVRVDEILDRPRRRHVGKFRRVGRAMFVETDLEQSGFRRRLTNVTIRPGDSMEATDGELVEVQILKRGTEEQPKKKRGAAPKEPAPLIGKVLQVLGRPGERPTEVKRLMIEHDLDVPFPEEVVAEAKAFGDAPTQEDLRGRRDLRQMTLVTIDGENARDFDDAVGAERDGTGYKLYVAIADVSHYVRVGTPLDEEALRRGTSTYLTDRAIPMLPEALSNGLCSLNPHVDRLCMLAEMSVDRTGHIASAKFERAVMRSQARLTYTRVARALEGEPDEETQKLLPTLLLLSRVANKLFERRIKRGAIDLDLPEAEIDFNAEGVPVNSRPRPRNDAHRLIEELMLAANEAVAQYFLDRSLPTVFRVHEDPDPAKLELFAGLCERLGVDVRLSEEPSPGEVAQLLEQISEHPQGKALHGLLLRSLKQARYDAECKGHFGLASKAYLHFTSPIRRYPDLIVHRLLKQSLAGEEGAYDKERLQEIAMSNSQSERDAMMAERDCIDLDRTLIAREHLGEEADGTITGIASFGMFVLIDAPFIEGLVPVQAMPDDFYEVDEFGATLVGQRTGRVFSLGDRVKVQIAAAHVSRRKVELRMIEQKEQDGVRRARNSRQKGQKRNKRRGSRVVEG
jgi:ribonuclease R